MHTIRRSALVEHSATRMFDLVNDVAAYPRRFDWCSAAELIEQGEARLVARLDLGLGSLRTWFTTENALDRPHRIDMNLVDGPFRKLLCAGNDLALLGHSEKPAITADAFVLGRHRQHLV